MAIKEKQKLISVCDKKEYFLFYKNKQIGRQIGLRFARFFI